MKKRIRTVTVHQRDALATDIVRVVETWTQDGLYMVRDLHGQKWRFPIVDVSLIVETPFVKVKVIGGKHRRDPLAQGIGGKPA